MMTILLMNTQILMHQLDDMAVREALRRLTEFWDIDWNEAKFLDCDGKEWNI